MDKVFEIIMDNDLFTLFLVKIPFPIGFCVVPTGSSVSFYFPRKSLAEEFMSKYKYPHSDSFWISKKNLLNNLEYLIRNYETDSRSGLLVFS